ncbi:MAG TPA: c-type cytochrome, partial [Gammaproteobacteria bacterium]
PGEPRSPIVKQMTPQPPPLPSRIRERTPEQLFWIVKHGIKYTAMPGWVTLEREDEVWSMVAFLQQLPVLGPDQYRRLAYGDVASAMKDDESGDAVQYFLRPLTEPLQLIVADCARCHGADGNGRGLGAFPKLAGQNEDYLLASLLAFSKGERLSGIMQPVAAGLSEETLRTLARYYARLSPSLSGNPSINQDSAAHGRKLAEQGMPKQGIPSCVHCHGPGREPRNPVYPELAGQYAGYLALQLELFKTGKRGGTPYAHIMNQVAARLTQAQIQDLAAYYASID